ncbi:MAG: S-adenosylmethionine decarboxylase [Bacteroidetes bacterium]|nr:MAG: S-adenosylmethionine decarboxylase [Bacteroidota bacterium]
MKYKPGKHIIAEFKTTDNKLLLKSHSFKVLIDSLVSSLDLSKVGEVYHDFEGGGYTAVVCLTESHLSVHTWPEFEMITFDVFLSNYLKENDDKVEQIFNSVHDYFNPIEVKRTTLNR